MLGAPQQKLCFWGIVSFLTNNYTIEVGEGYS